MAKKKTPSTTGPTETTPTAPAPSSRRRTAKGATANDRATTPGQPVDLSSGVGVSAPPAAPGPAQAMPAPSSTPAAPSSRPDGQTGNSPSYEQIATAAYHRYLNRGGGDGRDFDDWLEAERELRSR